MPVSGTRSARTLTEQDTILLADFMNTTGEPVFDGALKVALAVALGTRVPVWVYAVPGLKQLQDSAYAWIVRNRSCLPGDTPYCEHQWPLVRSSGVMMRWT